MKRSVIIPTYPGHFAANERFLRTLLRHGCDTEEILFRFIVGNEEEAAALSARAAFQDARKSFDVEAFPLATVLRMAGEAELIERATLERMGDRFSYQSLKKIAGLLAFECEEGFLLDSECRLLRRTSWRGLFKHYFHAPVVFFSDQTAPHLREVTEASLSLLSPEGLAEAHTRWSFEYQGWFYRRPALLAFAEHVRRHTGRSLPEALVERPKIFETTAYNWFLFRHPEHLPGGQLLSAEAALVEIYGEREGAAIIAFYRGKACGIVEHLLASLSIRRFRGHQRFVRRFGLQMLRVELEHARYQIPLVWLFLRLTPEIKMTVCSDGWAQLPIIARRNLRRLLRPFTGKAGG